MILKLLNNIKKVLFKKSLLTPVERGLIYKPVAPERGEMRDIEKSFARLFASEDGQRVLAYLQVLTFQRSLPQDASEGQLRYIEGQRALMGLVLRLIMRGRSPV